MIRDLARLALAGAVILLGLSLVVRGGTGQEAPEDPAGAEIGQTPGAQVRSACPAWLCRVPAP